MMTGYFFNAFFPARAGDLVRAYLLGRTTGMRKTTVLATIVIEKAFDGIALLVMLLVSLLLLPTVTTADSAAISPDLLALGYDPNRVITVDDHFTSATRAATVPTTRPVVREYASTAADWATTGAAVGVVSPNPSSKGATSAARQVADGHEVQGLGKVPECPS